MLRSELKARLARETVILALWYVVMVLIGIFVGWGWAFLLLTIIYLITIITLAMFLLGRAPHAP